MTTYVPPEQRPDQWATEAAAMYADGCPPLVIAARLYVDPDTVRRLIRAGLLRLAADRLQQLLADDADDWLDARVADYVDQDLLDPDAAVTLVALAVCTGDAVVLAEAGQRWTIRPEYAATATTLDIPEAITITDRAGGQIDLAHDSGRHEHGVDVSLLTRCYHLTAWDREDQEEA